LEWLTLIIIWLKQVSQGIPMNKEIRERAKAWAADCIEVRQYQFRASEVPGQIKITHKDGLWAGFYRPHPQYSYFVLSGFCFGNPEPEVRIIVFEYHRILKHFDLDNN
jgi:hypothetical protein